MKQFGHQGDAQWFKVDALPQGAKKVESSLKELKQ